MKLRLRTIAAGLALAGIASLPAQAAEVFNNGGGAGNFEGNNSFSESNIFVAEDFTFSSATTVRSLSFNAFTVDGETDPIETVNVKFYSDVGGLPGTEIYSAALTLAGSQFTGTSGQYALYDFFANTGDIAFAGGATYWMGLQIDPDQFHMHWSLNGYGFHGATAQIGDATGTPGGYGITSDFNTAFSLYDSPYGSPAPVPEPETYAMMLAGLGLLALARRRKARAA